MDIGNTKFLVSKVPDISLIMPKFEPLQIAPIKYEDTFLRNKRMMW